VCVCVWGGGGTGGVNMGVAGTDLTAVADCAAQHGGWGWVVGLGSDHLAVLQ
jgi:hypothetical protein